MELDELKLAWQTLDRRLEQQQAINLHLFTESRVHKAKSSLRWLFLCKIGQIALAAMATAFFAAFWIAHRHNPVLLVSGLAMHAYSVAMISTGVMELLLVVRIHYAAPVLTIQKYLNYLKLYRNRMMPWLGLSWWLLWIPLTLIAFKALLGVDLWANAPDAVGIFLLTGGAGLLATLWLVYASPQRLRKPIRAYLRDSNTGLSIQRAQAMLEELEQFEKE